MNSILAFDNRESASRPCDEEHDAMMGRIYARARAKRAARVASGFLDVIIVEPNQHGIGWQGFHCEYAFYRTAFRSNLTLVEFARKCFKHGILRKIAPDRYAVIRPSKAA